MATSTGIVWGSIVGGYGRIGIEVITNSTNNTTTTVTVNVWFGSKYSVSDSANSYYYNNLATAGSATTLIGSVPINTTVDSGEGWSTSNQVKLGSSTYQYTRGTSNVTRYLRAKLANVDRVGGTMYASASFTIPKLASYTVTYNANGGSGAPSSQTKWYGKTLVLSTTKPTRTGYTFQGWSTSSSGSVAYKAGANYTANAAVTLYAVWKANTYKVTYNANGGTNTPAAQTKTYGKTLTITSSCPTRDGYEFVGWATSSNSTTAAYKSGGSYTANAAVTLYAVWKVSYKAPRIVNVVIERNEKYPTYAHIGFEYECDLEPTEIIISCKASSDTDWTVLTYDTPSNITDGYTGTGGTVDFVDFDVIPYLEDISYDFRISVADNTSITHAYGTLSSIVYPIDVLAGGKGLAFGKAAEKENLAEFEFDAQFNGAVCGNVMGLNRLPEIPSGDDLNNYMNTGSYAVYKNDNASNIANMPVPRAGRLEVSAATGEGIRSEQWSYLRQRFIPYNESNAVWERDIARGSDNVWHYYDWWRSSLTPSASAKVYHEQKILWEGAMYMTETHSINLSEAVSKQPNGIVLVFSKYADGAAQENNFNSFFVPKLFVTSHAGYGNAFTMMDINFGQVCHKYLYINDTYISGHANNDATGTGTSGITYANNKFVLRYVIGV